MLTPRAYRLEDPALVARVLTDYPFATLVVGGNALDAAPIPLLHLPDRNCLLGHLSRQNPLVARLAAGEPALAIFSGPHAYISPTWYRADAVPTWDYVAVHVHVRARLLEGEAAHAGMAKLSAHFESGGAEPWTLSALSAQKLNANLAAITVFELEIERIEATAKLGQTRPDSEQAAVRQRLVQQGEQTLADWYSRMAPERQ